MLEGACPQGVHPYGKTLELDLPPTPKPLGMRVWGQWCWGMPPRMRVVAGQQGRAARAQPE